LDAARRPERDGDRLASFNTTMKRDLPMRTLATLGVTLTLDAMIILISRGPLACGVDDKGSNLAALFTLVSLVLLVGGPSTLIAIGLRDTYKPRPALAYALIICGVPVVIALSIWAIASSFGAASCGSSLIMG
jgi:hypothetical protein